MDNKINEQILEELIMIRNYLLFYLKTNLQISMNR